MVEGRSFDPDSILVAHSLNCVSRGRYIVVRCLNTSAAVVLVKAGMIVAQFQPFKHVKVSELPIWSATSKVSAAISYSLSVRWHTKCAIQQEDSSLQRKALSDNDMPAHFKQLFEKATQVCHDDSQGAWVRGILITYSDRFSRPSSDIGRTELIERLIPLLPNTVPICHAPRMLGKKRETEVDRQIDDLHAKSLIKPADSNWSSRVVPIKKRDGSFACTINDWML